MFSNFTTFSWGQTSPRVTSIVANVEAKDNQGRHIVMSNLTKDINMTLPQRVQQHHVQNDSFAVGFGRTVYHKVHVKHNDITLSITVSPTDNNTLLVCAVGFQTRPTKDEDYRHTSPHNLVYAARRPGMYFIGVRVGLDVNNPGYTVPQRVSYKVQVTESACLFWSPDKQEWISDGCKVG